MLKLKLNWRDLDSLWSHQSGGGWSIGSSYVIPFNHPLLESFIVQDPQGGRSLLVVRERLSQSELPEAFAATPIIADPDQYEQIKQAQAAYSLEFATVEIIQGQCPEIHLQAGVWGTAPVYLTTTVDGLVGDWDITNLYPFVDQNSIDPAHITLFLTGLDPYSSNTLFRNIQRLTERAAFCATPQAAHLALPSDAESLRTYEVNDELQVLPAYRSILSATLSRWAFTDINQIGAELSGGLDSGVVSATMAKLYTPLKTYGLIIDGAARQQQIERRQILCQAFHAQDQTIDALSFPPLLDRGVRLNRKVSLYEEPYTEALTALIQSAQTQGTQILLTGVGGDELMLPASFGRTKTRSAIPEAPSFFTQLARSSYREALAELREGRSPKSIIPATALLAVQCRALVFLRQGLWSVNPLCSPELVRFCHRLPVRWRINKRLHAEILLNAGLPQFVVKPPLRETFASVMNKSMTMQASTLRKLFVNMLSDQLNLVDAARIVHEYERYLNQSSGCWKATTFFRLATLELTLRSCFTHPEE